MTSQRESMELAPVRSMSEFLLDGSKYLAPSFTDLKSFNNRMCSNLLYFQTNYLIMSLANFLIFLLMGFNKMFCGALVIGASILIALIAMDKVQQFASIKAQYPIAVFALGFADILLCYMMARSLMFFLLSILLPVLFWLIHASVRSRNVANKVKNKLEQVGVPVYNNTPMSFILSTIGVDTKDYTD